MAGDRINFGINFDVGSAIKELGLVESALKSISNIANGMGMEKYWKTQEQLVTELRKSYQDFLNVQSKDSASELIKTANALKAIAGIDITKSISGLGDITDTLSKAAKLAPEIANSFSPETFRSTFDALDTLKKQGADVNDVISRLSTNSDVTVLNKRIEELGERLSDARNRASSLEQELSDAKSGAGITELERRIEGLNDDLEIAENRLQRVRAEAESEFDNFLRGHNIKPDDWEFSSYYENIRDGSETAIEAISRFRVEYQHLFDQADQGNTALAVLDSFQAKIDRLIEETTSLSAAISDMQMNGVKTSADGASNSLQGLADAMMAINNSSSDSSASGVQQNITSLVEKLNDLAGVDVERLQNVRGILLSIVNMNGLSVTKTPVNNISALLDTVKTFGKDGSSIAIPDFSKLNDLNINAEQLKTLASYLPKIATGNYAGLHELEGITFDNLKNLSLENSVASIKAIASLTRALNGSDLSSANAFLTGLDFSKVQNVGVDEKLGAFATALAQLSKVPFEPLKNILSLSFQNLNSIDIKENAAQSIESLARSLTTLSGARDELQQIIDFVSGYKASGAAGGGGGPIISPKLNDELDGAKRKLESISAIYDKTKEQSQQLVGYTKNYVAELDKYIQKSHDIYRVDYDEQGTPTETLVTRNVLDSLVEKEKLTKKAEQADIKANITTQNLIRTVNSYAATLEKSSKAASQAGLEDDQRVVGLNKIIQDLHALSLMIKSASPDELLDLREVLSGIQIAGDKAKASVDGIVSAEKEVGKNTAALREEETAFVRFDTAISNLIAKYKKYVAAAEEANLQDNESVKSLQGYISALENLQSSANTPDSAGVKEFNAELVKIDNNASKAAQSVQSITTAAMKDAANEAQTQADTIKAIAKYEAIRKQIINDINKSSKAEHGKSSQDYSNLVQYRDSVEQLYQEYTHGSKSLQDFRDGLENIANGAAGASNNIRQAGEMTMSFGDRIKKAMGNLSAYFGVSRVIMQVVRYARDLVKTSIELDKEMGQLRIVTDETEDAYSKFSESIAKTAKEIGASMTDLISATTTFARLGYSLDESSVLAKYTAMIQQVGDIDAQSAQNAITAITKAFSDEVDINNIESVMDRLVVVGRNIAHVCSDAYLVIGYNGQSRFGMIA